MIPPLERAALTQVVRIRIAAVAFGSASLAVLVALTTGTLSAGPTPEFVPRTRDDIVQYAEKLLAPQFRRASISDHIVVTSDCHFARADVVMARNFEAVYKVLQTILRVSPGSQVSDANKVHAYLFQSKEQYEKFERFAGSPSSNKSSGMYFTGYGILAFHLEMYTQPWVRHVMLHECTHAFLDQRVRLTDHRIPTWLQEGLAEYIGLSDVSEGQIHVGVFTTKTRHESYEGTIIARSEASDQLSRAQHALRRTLDLDTLLTTEPLSLETLKSLQEYYASCWLLVDYLRGSHKGWSQDQFPTLVREIGAGHSDRETLETVYGLTAKELETGLSQHVKNLKLVRGTSAPVED